NGTEVVSTARVFTQGALKETGEQLDLAIEGKGFLEVRLPDGTLGFTRDGALKVAGDGRITTSSGLPVMSNFQALPQGVTAISMAPTGEVTVQTASGEQMFRVQLIRFSNPAGLRSLGGNLYVET